MVGIIKRKKQGWLMGALLLMIVAIPNIGDAVLRYNPIDDWPRLIIAVVPRALASYYFSSSIVTYFGFSREARPVLFAELAGCALVSAGIYSAYVLYLHWNGYAIDFF